MQPGPTSPPPGPDKSPSPPPDQVAPAEAPAPLPDADARADDDVVKAAARGEDHGERRAATTASARGRKRRRRGGGPSSYFSTSSSSSRSPSAAAAGTRGVVMVKRDLLARCMTCPLCRRLLRDATTISECLHTCESPAASLATYVHPSYYFVIRKPTQLDRRRGPRIPFLPPGTSPPARPPPL